MAIELPASITVSRHATDVVDFSNEASDGKRIRDKFTFQCFQNAVILLCVILSIYYNELSPQPQPS